MNMKIRQLFLMALLLLPAMLYAQGQQVDSTYCFRFVAERDMFYSPWNGNGKELERLQAAIEANRTAIENGQMYLYVTSYGADGESGLPAAQMAKIRRNRVKSELIVHAGLKESNFVTEKSPAKSYQAEDGELRNVVVVMLPAPADKVAQLAGEEAAAKVRAYNDSMLRRTTEVAPARQPEPKTTPAVAEQPRKEQPAPQETAPQTEPAETKATDDASPYHFALRTNLLRWATLTPDLGIEWRINHHVGILVNGSYTSWDWDNKNRRYSLWEVNPEVRWYQGTSKNWYLGAMYKVGSFNYKLSKTGKQGDLMGGGITGGYMLKLNKSLSMDFSLGLGYVHADYDKYTIIDNVRVRQGNATKNWFGPIQAGVSLVWNMF